jgi:hypothetical protein
MCASDWNIAGSSSAIRSTGAVASRPSIAAAAAAAAAEAEAEDEDEDEDAA